MSRSNLQQKRLRILLISLLAGSVGGFWWWSPKPTPLTVGAYEVEEWRHSASPSYTLELAKGQMAQLILEQQGVDLVVEVDTGDGSPFEVDSPTGRRGDEVIFLAAAEDDMSVALSLRSFNQEITPGAGYRFGIEQLQPATPHDLARAEAEELFHRARMVEEKRQPGFDAQANADALRGLKLFASIEQVERQADTYFLLGKLYDLAYRRQDSAASYEASLALSERPDSFVQLADAYMTLGRWADSESAYRRAVELYAGRGGSAEGTAWKGLGDLQRRCGQFGAAVASLNKAYEILRLTGPASKRLSTLNSLGLLQLSQGAPEKALPFLQQALREVGKEDRETRVKTLSSIADVYLNLGNLDQAREHFQSALLLEEGRFEEGRHSRMEGVLWVGLGRLAERQGDTIGAERKYLQALSLFEALPMPLDAAITRNNLAWLSLSLGETGAARERFQQALEEIQPLGESSLEGVLHFGLARVAREEGDLEAAEEKIQAAIEAIELLRARSHFQDRMPVLASRFEVLSFYIDLLMQQHPSQPDLRLDRIAAGVSEQTKARSLLDALGRDGVALEPEDDEGGWLVSRRLAQDTAAQELSLRRLTQQGASSDVLESLRTSLTRSVHELVQRQEELIRQDPKIAAVRQPRSLVLPILQETLLDDETLLLSYHLGRQSSFLWVIGKTSVHSFELDDRKTLEALVRRLDGEMEQRSLPLNQDRVAVILERLAAAVLPPSDVLSSARRLVIVPSGELFRVPFAALPWPPATPSDAGADSLLSRFEVVYLPSSSVLASSRLRATRRSPPRRRLAVFADPVFTADDTRVDGVDIVSRPSSRLDLSRLPETAVEAEAVAQALDDGSNLLALGHDVYLDKVIDGELSDFRYLHFATHGMADAESPEQSFLALSQLTADGQWQDGRLTAHQVADLELSAELVVLSACRSGPGRPIRGEGLTGLARSFLLAGAQRVIVSLWQVDDQAAAELMRRFYVTHGKGVPAAEALRKAQLEMQQESRWHDPYYWAGFVLFGDWK